MTINFYCSLLKVKYQSNNCKASPTIAGNYWISEQYHKKVNYAKRHRY